MSEKVNQHYVPQVFLKSFCDPERPRDFPPGKPFEPAPWLLDKSLRKVPRQRAPKNLFKANRPYNLRSDIPNELFLEDSFSRIEGIYAKLLPLLKDHQELQWSDYVSLVVFMGTLYTRNLDELAHWQRQFEQLEAIYRTLARGNPDEEGSADRIFRVGDEISKLMLPGFTSSYAQVIAPYGWLLINNTPLPFFTSDSPVVHTLVHPDDLKDLLFPDSFLARNSSAALPIFLSYCALLPNLAHISSPLLTRPQGSFYRTTNDPGWIFMLNELTRRGAKEFIASPNPAPYGVLTERVADSDRSARQENELRMEGSLQIYTRSAREWINTSFLSIETDGPQTRLRFRTNEIGPLHRLAYDGDIIKLQSFQNGHPATLMRGAHFLYVAIEPGGESVVEW